MICERCKAEIGEVYQCRNEDITKCACGHYLRNHDLSGCMTICPCRRAVRQVKKSQWAAKVWNTRGNESLKAQLAEAEQMYQEMRKNSDTNAHAVFEKGMLEAQHASETKTLKAQLAEANAVLDTIGDQAGPMYVSGTDAEGERTYQNHYQSLSYVYDLAYAYRNKYPTAKKEATG